MKKIVCVGCFEEYEESMERCPFCGAVKGERINEEYHLKTGTLLKGQYQIGRTLGSGGFGVTYLAWDTVLNRKIAVKEYFPCEFSTRSPECLRVTVYGGKKEEQFEKGKLNFIKEAKKMAQFQNEIGIAKIYDSFQENNTAYLVMEYVNGNTLEEVLEKENRMDASLAIGMMMPVMKALQAVHEKDIVHRDVSPDNILIGRDGRVCLIDFGAARYATTSYTRSLTVLIKEGYSPEEQYQSNGKQGAFTDVYSMAAVLYRMITGVVPPDALERRAYLEKGKKDILKKPSDYVKGLDKNIENALLNALNVKTDDRTPNMEQLIEELTSEKDVKRKHGNIRKMDFFKWPWWAKAGSAIGVILLAVIAFLFRMGIVGTPEVIIPAVIPDGMTRVVSVVNDEFEMGTTRLSEARLQYSIGGYETDFFVPMDTIMKQDLKAGCVTGVNSLVRLTISKGVKQELVENYQGMELEMVISLLIEKKLIVKLSYQYDDVIETGCIISQSVPVNTYLEQGSTIELIVSKGKEEMEEAVLTEVPEFVGHTYAEALEIAKEKKLRVLIESREFSEEYEENVIMKQSIQPGEKILNDNVIYFVVSKGVSSSFVADVIGYDAEKAEEILVEQGFAVKKIMEYSDLYLENIVFRQNPEAKKKLEKGKTVTITVSKGSEGFLLDDVNGMEAEEAIEKLESKGLSVSVVYDFDGNISENCVISQSVEAGTKVKRGDEITLVICTSEELISVPDVEKTTLNQAKSMIEDAGLQFSQAEVYSTEVKKGDVISQTPAAGSKVKKGTVIVATVSKGPETFTVPDLTGKTFETISGYFTLRNITIEKKEVYDESIEKGIIVAQTPAAGSLIEEGSMVSVTISKGKQPVQVPSVVGITFEQAEKQLTELGLMVVKNESYSASVAAGKVISQSFVNGAMYKGDEIQVTVSLGAPDIPVESVSLNKTSVSIRAGESIQLLLSVSPSNAQDKSYIVKSSDSSIAEVSNNGLVTAKKKGTAEITFQSLNNAKARATCRISVQGTQEETQPETQPTQSEIQAVLKKIEIETNPDKMIYYDGEQLDTTGLKLRAINADGSYKTVTDGYAIKYGSLVNPSVKLTANSSESMKVYIIYQEKTAEINVTVKNRIMIDRGYSDLQLQGGQTVQLGQAVSVYPENLRLEWTSDNEKLATVEQNGLVTANKNASEGIVNIKAETTYNGQKYSQSIRITITKDYFEISNHTLEKYTGNAETVVIPDEVTVIGAAFLDNHNIKAVSMSDQVTSIEDFAFMNCFELKSVRISNQVTKLGYRAFAACKNLESIVLPPTLKELGSDVFCMAYSLKNVEIPDDVEKIGSYAFYQSGLDSEIRIPASVHEIGMSAFIRCHSLKKINVDPANNNYCSDNGVLFTKDGKNLISCPAGYELTEYTIPSSVTHIAWEAFLENQNIKKVVIPNSVEEIGIDAFRDSNIEGIINIPASVVSIMEGAFSGCANLKMIKVDSLNNKYTSQNGIVYTKDMKTLISCPGGYELEEIFIPDTVTSIDRTSFSYNRYIKTIHIPSSVESIGIRAFQGCQSLQKVYIPPEVKSIQDSFCEIKNMENLTFYGQAGSYAHQYARENGIKFVAQ